MSAVTDLVEKIKATGIQVFEKVQETPAYISLKERYDNLPANGQKAVIGLAVLAVVAFFLSFPLSSYWAASESVSAFEEKRNLIQDLFRVSTEGQVSLPVDPPPPIESVKSQIESKLQQSQLTPEQLKGISVDSVPSVFSKETVDGALSISLAKLNLRQVVDIGYQIQSISSGIKMIDLLIQANAADSHYFDVIYKIMTLKVPDFSVALDSETAPPPPGGRKKSPAKNPKADDL